MSGAGTLPRVFGVLMTRNDADLLRLNIVRHLAGHCERIIVVDNGSSDETPKLLARLAKRLPVTWTRDDGPLQQAEIVTAMLHEARRAGAEWVVPLDTDEFWHAPRLLPEVLAQSPQAGMVEVPRIEFIQRRTQDRATRSSVLHATMRVEHPLMGAEPRNEFAAGRRSLFELMPDPKVIVRCAPGVTVERGAHTATGIVGPKFVSDQVAIFHVPIRAREQLAERVSQGRRIAELSDDPDISYQNRYWHRLGEAGRLDEGWDAHSYANGALSVAGRHVELVEDGRLAEILAPFVRTPFKQRLARLAGHAW